MQRPQQRLAIDFVLALARGEIVHERLIRHLALPVRRLNRQLSLDAKARYAGQLEEIAAVTAFSELGETADAANVKKMRPVFIGARMRRIRLNHADQPIARA